MNHDEIRERVGQIFKNKSETILVSSGCHYFVEELNTIQGSEKNPEDLAPNQSDHSSDTFRYYAVSIEEIEQRFFRFVERVEKIEDNL